MMEKLYHSVKIFFWIQSIITLKFNNFWILRNEDAYTNYFLSDIEKIFTKELKNNAFTKEELIHYTKEEFKIFTKMDKIRISGYILKQRIKIIILIKLFFKNLFAFN